MSVFKLPLSGDVSQWINPITSWWSGNQISVNLGESGSPEAEAEILRRIGSYGRQLGKIDDVLTVLIAHLDRTSLSPLETEAINEFEDMAKQIGKIKRSHKKASDKVDFNFAFARSMKRPSSSAANHPPKTA
jgi:hypothetical protein